MNRFNSILFLFGILLPAFLIAQEETPKLKYIQFSGIVVTEGKTDEPQPLPYTNISVLNSSRGTISEFDGFFSLVAEAGDTIVFSRVGFETTQHVIADTLTHDYYSWYQVMSNDNVLLPEAVIYPWPSKLHYKQEFLAIDVTNDMRERMQENLAEQVLREMRQEMPYDGGEAYSHVLQDQIYDARYSGQYKPMNIFNPISWAQFVKAWKNGDFKKKEDDKKK